MYPLSHYTIRGSHMYLYCNMFGLIPTYLYLTGLCMLIMIATSVVEIYI